MRPVRGDAHRLGDVGDDVLQTTVEPIGAAIAGVAVVAVMNRRAALSTLATGLAIAAGGCIQPGERTEPAPSSDAITDAAFELLDDEDSEHPSEPPGVGFEADETRVVVTGRLLVGSEKCKEAKLESVVYRESEDHLSVVVTDGKSDAHPDEQFLGSGSCDDVMSADTYRVTVTFGERLPAKVTAIERDAAGQTKSATATPDSR